MVMSLSFDLQPILQNKILLLQPLKLNDFEVLFQVASDPLIWEQHPNRNRYQKEVFAIFFTGAIESGGAFLIFNQSTGKVIGSTRFYDWDSEKRSISIGYTFFAREYWGGIYNPAAKALLINHAFQFVDEVHFHIGALNLRSQKAIEKLGAEKIAEKEIAYHGEANTLNFIYRISKMQWLKQSNQIRA